SVFAQLIFGGASFLSPFVYSYLVLHLKDGVQSTSGWLHMLARLTPEHLPWVSLYWIFGLITLSMIGWISLTKFPGVERKEDELTGAWKTHRELFRNRTVLV